LTHSALADAEVPPVDIVTTKCFSETSEHAFQCSFAVPKCGSVKILHIRFHVILERIEQWVVAEEGATAQHKAAVALLSANQVWFARNNGHWSRIAKHARH
jgi:hypothetical protein